jgi:hypothetical protein
VQAQLIGAILLAFKKFIFYATILSIFILLRQNTHLFKTGDEWRVEPFGALREVGFASKNSARNNDF